MPITYQVIASNTLATSVASVTFSSIPDTYTDLLIKMSCRTTGAGSFAAAWLVTFNSTSSGYSNTWMRGNGATSVSQRYSNTTSLNGGWENASGATASTFDSSEILIPGYVASRNKPILISNITETNATTAYIIGNSGLWRDTTAISSIQISPSAGSWDTGSSFFLYGIKNS